MLILSVGLVAGGILRVVFLPEIPSDFIQIDVTMVEGSPELQTTNVMNKLEESALALNGQFEFRDAETGEISTEILDHLLIIGAGAASGVAVLELIRMLRGQVDLDLITEYMRDYVGLMPGMKNIVFNSSDGFGGSAISYQLVSENPDELTAAAIELEAHLYTYAGLINITNGAVSSKDELRLQIKSRAEVMGLNLNDISSQVRSAFFGAEAQRLQRGDDELKVMVSYPESDRVSIGNLENMYIRTNQEKLFHLHLLQIFKWKQVTHESIE